MLTFPSTRANEKTGSPGLLWSLVTSLLAMALPEGGGCHTQSYSSLWSNQSRVTVNVIIVSHIGDMKFPNEDECFKLGEVTLSLGGSVPFTV